MKAIAVNASPRKTFNTAKLLQSALDGAASAGAETELVHLADLKFKGCTSCFACHRKNNPEKYHCCYRDELTPVLRRIEQCDALIVGSPIYLGDVSSLCRAFLERFGFQYVSYNELGKNNTMFTGKANGGFIFVMNCPEDFARENHGYVFENCTDELARLRGYTEYMLANETYQFDDYSKYECEAFDVEYRAKVRDEVFPEKLREAFEMGRRLVKTE